MKPHDLWLIDLDNFENAYDSWIEAKKEKENNNVPHKKVKK